MPSSACVRVLLWPDREGYARSAPRSSGPHKRLVIGPLNRKSERRLLLDADDDFDPNEAFPLLLDSLEDALGVVDTGNGTPEGPQ